LTWRKQMGDPLIDLGLACDGLALPVTLDEENRSIWVKDACRETMWDFYSAPKPWGPWIKVSSYRSSPQGYYSPQVCPKFIRDGGKSLFVFTAGDWNNKDVYRLTVVPITIRN
jgi:hypothetical protein